MTEAKQGEGQGYKDEGWVSHENSGLLFILSLQVAFFLSFHILNLSKFP